MNATGEYPRWLRPVVLSDLETHPVVVVVGARQVGKSTLCSQIAIDKGFIPVTLDDANHLAAARKDPMGFLEKLGPSALFIDEAQRAPELFLAIKARVDRDQRAGAFLLCGSNQPDFRRAVGDSLVGRAVYRPLHPLTLGELRYEERGTAWSFLFSSSDDDAIDELQHRRDSHGPLDWKDVVSTGGFPRAVNVAPSLRLQLLDDYLKVFTSRDIQEVLGVDALDRFESFMRLLASRIAQPLNYSSIAADLGLSVSTVRRWTDALRRSYMIELIEPYSRNASQRVIKAPKMVFADSALAQAGARESEPNGFHLENLIATDLTVWQAGAAGRGLYYWRLSSGQEVDFVLEQNRTLLPLEIKVGSAIDSSDARHLKAFLEKHDRATRGLLLSADPTVRLLGGGVIAAPWWAAI